MESKIVLSQTKYLILVSDQYTHTEHVDDDDPRGHEDEDSPLPDWDCYVVVSDGGIFFSQGVGLD